MTLTFLPGTVENLTQEMQSYNCMDLGVCKQLNDWGQSYKLAQFGEGAEKEYFDFLIQHLLTLNH